MCALSAQVNGSLNQNWIMHMWDDDGQWKSKVIKANLDFSPLFHTYCDVLFEHSGDEQL